jgi:hypothetical protein
MPVMLRISGTKNGKSTEQCKFYNRFRNNLESSECSQRPFHNQPVPSGMAEFHCKVLVSLVQRQAYSISFWVNFQILLLNALNWPSKIGIHA